MAEIFNQQRMSKCIEIHRSIMNNWRQTGDFNCTIRATDSVEGITLDELRKRYFAVGVGDDLTEIPFTDLLVILSMKEQEFAALKEHLDSELFEISFQVTTDYPDEEAVRLLSGIRIETPYDKGTHLQFSETWEPPPE